MSRRLGVGRLPPLSIALVLAVMVFLAGCAQNDADGLGEPLEVPLWVRTVDEDTVGLRSPTFR